MPASLPREMPLLPSLLDDHPEEQSEPAWREATVVGMLEADICRDVQNMLNARRALSDIPERYHELPTSLMNYRLPDLQSMEGRENHELARLCRLIGDMKNGRADG